MASHPPDTCCTVGVKHGGTPQGEMKTIGDTETYIAPLPPSPKGAILFLTDVFGHRFPNNQLLADQFAANGYTTLMPDLFHGDMMTRAPDFDRAAWLSRHGPAATESIVQATLQYMTSALGVVPGQKVGAVGYCFGAKYVVRGLGDGSVAVGYVAHPTYVEEEELRGIRGGLSIAAAETDGVFPPEKRHKSEEILKEVGQPYQINLFSGVSHGFAVRCNLENRVEKYAMEQAFLQAVHWFDEYLKA